jgi:hypothetical protein
MTTYRVKTKQISSKDFGLKPGAFQAIICADENAQFYLEREDKNIQTWTLKTSFNVDTILDSERDVISYTVINEEINQILWL